MAPIKFRIENDRNAVSSNFERLGWQRTEGDDWNIFWSTVGTVKALFNPETHFRLNDYQLICHYPNHYELTRKDLLVKNIKRYCKEYEKNYPNNPPLEPFLPVTYLLPADYSLFVEEFRRYPNAMWIMKPSNRAQGKGIFIINKLQQIKKWSSGRWASKDQETYVVSRYVENPLLIGGKKFDLRIYVLITSFRPLRMYLGDGFARFCNVKYSYDQAEMDNPFIHLTNVAIQKQNEEYNDSHGGKWRVANLRTYLEHTRGYEATKKMFEDIDELIVHSAKAVQNIIVNDRHCFECYGYDLLIDDELKPWLVEVNASPSLSATTHSDKQMKTTLIRDVLDIVVPSEFTPDFKGAHSTGPCVDQGDFVVLYDEAAEIEKLEAAEREKKGGKENRKTTRSWK
jgi:tubulin polyglutamylase TTLL1